MIIKNKIERPAEYSKLAEHDNQEALIALLGVINLQCRFGEYAHPYIIKSEDYPGLYGSKTWILALHNHYKLGREHKKTWNRTWNNLHWFLIGFDAASHER